MATTKIKVYNLTMSGIDIGKEVSCSATLTNNLEEAEYKDSVSPMNPEQTVVSKTWSMQKDITELKTLADLRALVSAALSDRAIVVAMTTGSDLLSGNAFVNDLSIQAPNRQNTKATIQFQGTGAIS